MKKQAFAANIHVHHWGDVTLIAFLFNNWMTFSALENEISPSIIFPYGSLCHVPPQGFGYVLVRMFFLPYITCLLGLLNVFLRYYPLQKRLKKCYYPKSKRYMLSNVHSLKRSFFLIL